MEIMAELNLKKIIGESREVAQALHEFADELERIEKKYADPQESEEAKTEAIVARPKCAFCEYAALSVAQGQPCFQCYYTENRPNFKPNARCLELYEKVKEGIGKNE